MGFKAIARARQIADEQNEIDTSVARSVSGLNRDLVRVLSFAAFSFNSYLNGDGDVDAADITAIITEFQAQRALIDAFIPMLDDVQGINDEATPANIPANLAAFIAKYGIDLDSYGARFD